MANLMEKSLYLSLYNFIKESISFLKKNANISLIPTIPNYKVLKESGKLKIQRTENPNWWQVSKYLNSVVDLKTYKIALKLCKQNKLIYERHNQRAYAFNAGHTFDISNVPIAFLTEVIVRENGFRFRQKTLETVFNDFLS